jgi:hypothetical protein
MEKLVKMCQFYSDSSRFFLQPTVLGTLRKKISPHSSLQHYLVELSILR